MKLPAFFILCLLIAPSLYAQNSYSEFERGLGLSNPQRTQIEGIRNRYTNEFQSLRQESMKKRLELRELSRNPRANTERIGRVQGEIQELDTAKHNLYQQYRGEVSRTLNDRQREHYKSFCDQERRKNPNRFNPRRYGR